MASTTSDDEFDQLPDPFAGIDWNKVPGLSAVTPSQPSTEPQHSIPSHSQTNVSDQYSYDEVDAAFLAEVDQVERRLLPPPVVGSGSASFRASNGGRKPETTTHSDTASKLSSRYFRTDRPTEGDPSSSQGANGRVRDTSPRAESGEDGNLPVLEAEVKPLKIVHRRSSPPPREPSPKKYKGKQKESSREILEEVLNNLEDEMVCPICCDIFAHAHLGNPCGHTFCGECGWRWIQKNGTPSCAICRANLSVDVPMIPNFAVDNAVEKHVHALRIGGMEGWEIDGSKFAEWQGRKARWKADFAKKTARRSTTINAPLFGVQHALGDASGADYAEEEAESSGAGSSDASEDEGEREAGAVQQELTRRVNNPHRHHRRPGGNRNRQHRASGERHDAGRSGSNPRGRRSRRRRRRD
ncbi:hypothetical protein EDB87DRAFT_1594004 [Lactarius vividus]|nr:hypothetical protein EDB87DRAFT_1594004 [Lactarius vividus]